MRHRHSHSCSNSLFLSSLPSVLSHVDRHASRTANAYETRVFSCRMQACGGDPYLMRNLSMPSVSHPPFRPHWLAEPTIRTGSRVYFQEYSIRSQLPILRFWRSEAAENRKEKSSTWAFRTDAGVSFCSLSLSLLGSNLRCVCRGREYFRCKASVARDLVFGPPLTHVQSAPANSHSHNGAGKGDYVEGNQGEKLAVVGVGSKVPTILNYCVDSTRLPSAEFWSISPDSHAIQQFDHAQQSRGSGGKEGCKISFKEFSSQDVLNIKGALFLLGAGSMVALQTTASLLQAAQKQGVLAVSLVVMPFLFEGHRRRKEAEKAMAVLSASSDLLIVVEQDALMQETRVTLSKAGRLACAAVLGAIKAISDLLLGHEQVVLDMASTGRRTVNRSEVYSILQQGGKACVGFGEGENVKAAIEAAALDSPFIQGWLAEEKGTVLCTVASVNLITPQEVAECLWLLRCLVGPNLQLVCTPTRVSSFKPGIISATIIITGLAKIGTCSPALNNELTGILMPLASNNSPPCTINNEVHPSRLQTTAVTEQGGLKSTTMNLRGKQRNGVLLVNVSPMSRAIEIADVSAFGMFDQFSPTEGKSPTRKISEWTEKSAMLELLKQRNPYAERIDILEAADRRNNSFAALEGTFDMKQAKLPIINTMKPPINEISWTACPSSAIALAWAQSRAEVQKPLVSVGTEEGAHYPLGDVELELHLGIRPHVEQQRVVIPKKSVPMEVVPVDPATFPRWGMGAMLDLYRAMLQGKDKGKEQEAAETPVQRSLSQRAASMLEIERSRKKLTPVTEMQYDMGVYKGRCVAGLPDGKGRLTYKDGSFYEGQWKKGKRQGAGTFYCTSGDVFQGSWKDDLKHGKGWFYFHNGDRLYANYVNGKANGEGRIYFTEGDVFFGHFRDNWRHGESLYIDSAGVRWRESWEDGVLLSKMFSKDLDECNSSKLVT